MTDLIITSRTNPLVKEVRALTQKKAREQRGEFLVEGIQPVVQAIESGAPIRLLIVAPELLTSEVAQAAIARQEKRGTRKLMVSRSVFETLTEREHPAGVAAVVQIQPQELANLRVDANALFVGLYQVSNPGNLGAILRTADAVRTRGVILVGNATDPYAPAAVKASRGALFTVPLVRVRDLFELMAWCGTTGVRLVATSDAGAAPLWHADLRTPLLCLFGNEGEGLPPEVLAQGAAVRIPMEGRVDSLNLAVAAGVLLYECVRQRDLRDGA